jgi:hypothetical protein
LFDIFSTGFHLLLVLVALVVWKLSFFPSNLLRARHLRAALWLVLMFACASVIYCVLIKWSSPSVRDDVWEISFYLVFSMVWVALAQSAFAFLGVSLRDDVAERGNNAAGFASVGLTIAATCCVACASIGDGPGIQAVLFCAALATVSVFLLWLLVARASDAADRITIERDSATGIRVGGWLAGTGIVIGACVAGDWISLAATLRDFAKYSWPAIGFAFVFAQIERSVSRREPVERPSEALSWGEASLMVLAASFYANWIGRRG